MICPEFENQKFQYIRSDSLFLLVDKTNNYTNLLFNANDKIANNYILNLNVKKMTNINICYSTH